MSQLLYFSPPLEQFLICLLICSKFANNFDLEAKVSCFIMMLTTIVLIFSRIDIIKFPFSILSPLIIYYGAYVCRLLHFAGCRRFLCRRLSKIYFSFC
jgi:hypothetical protein